MLSMENIVGIIFVPASLGRLDSPLLFPFAPIHRQDRFRLLVEFLGYPDTGGAHNSVMRSPGLHTTWLYGKMDVSA